jgi:hypothetical protein
MLLGSFYCDRLPQFQECEPVLIEDGFEVLALAVDHVEPLLHFRLVSNFHLQHEGLAEERLHEVDHLVTGFAQLLDGLLQERPLSSVERSTLERRTPS